MNALGVGVTGPAKPIVKPIVGIDVNDEIKRLENRVKSLKESIKAHKDIQNSFDVSFGHIGSDTLYLYNGDYLSSSKSIYFKKVSDKKLSVKKSTPMSVIRGSYVYILLLEDVPVYIGQSSNVFARVAAHERDKKKMFDRVRIMKCRKDRKMYWEKKLIKAYKPIHNKLWGT